MSAEPQQQHDEYEKYEFEHDKHMVRRKFVKFSNFWPIFVSPTVLGTFGQAKNQDWGGTAHKPQRPMRTLAKDLDKASKHREQQKEGKRSSPEEVKSSPKRPTFTPATCWTFETFRSSPRIIKKISGEACVDKLSRNNQLFFFFFRVHFFSFFCDEKLEIFFFFES